MSFRFQKFTTVYSGFLRKFLIENPDYPNLTYQELYDRLMKIWYGLGNYYSKHMRALGHEAEDLFADIEPLQKAWAKEQGVSYNKDNWLHDIVIAQVRHFQPDILYLQDLYVFDESFRKDLRDACDCRVILIGWRAAPTKNYAKFRDLDMVVTAAPNFERAFRHNGVNSVCLPLGFEPTALDAISPMSDRDLDFTFVGKLGRSCGPHAQRYALLEQLMKHTPLQVWGETSPFPSLSGQMVYALIYQSNVVLKGLGVSDVRRRGLPIVGRGISWTDPFSKPFWECYPERCHAPVFGLENLKILSRSRIAFNSHIDVAENYAGNIRLYEATGMGACLLTDWKENLPEFFEPEVEVVTYRSAGECIDKVRYLLEHDAEREAIARAGQRRTLREHTYFHRVQRLAEIIESIIKSPSKKTQFVAENVSPKKHQSVAHD